MPLNIKIAKTANLSKLIEITMINDVLDEQFL